MNYLKQLKRHITNGNYAEFLNLWEEYCMGDEIETEELKRILETVKSSSISTPFGKHVEEILPLWEQIPDQNEKEKIFQLIIDLQTTETGDLAEMAYTFLKEKYGDHPQFALIIKLVGLRDKVAFQGAVTNFLLLAHLKKGNFVFHGGGWGVGEIMDVSFIREQISLEFDFVPGLKDMSFKNAIANLVPLSSDHFLSRRFGNPDALEAEAKNDPLAVMHLMLRDMGPQTASDIKNELNELVIPENDWAKWWQGTRTKLKKDPKVSTPGSSKEPFELLEKAVSYEEQMQKELEKEMPAREMIQKLHIFLRDFPATLKNTSFRSFLENYLTSVLEKRELSDGEMLQVHFLLEDIGSIKEYQPVEELVKRLSSFGDILASIETVAFKKQLLMSIRRYRDDWAPLLASLFLNSGQNSLRDYIFTELVKGKEEGILVEKLEELIAYPNRHPNTFVWYFQKMIGKPNLPLGDDEGRNRFFESFLILLSILEKDNKNRDIIKRMHTLLISGRYANVRKIFQHAPIEYVREFLLLATKCHSLTEHDIKIFHSLAEVVHPSLGKLAKKYDEVEEEKEEDIIWTTEEGYHKMKERIHNIATVETVENAKEIEVARSHGDLRENAEFKSALEKRDRLQGELKFLTDQFQNARILTKKEVETDKVGVGVVVDCSGDKDVSYTLLGPWEADPDKAILSVQSQLAQNMIGKKVGEQVTIQGKDYTIKGIRNYFGE